jgi:tetratricopeptide (TPR) repeat protein
LHKGARFRVFCLGAWLTQAGVLAPCLLAQAPVEAAPVPEAASSEQAAEEQRAMQAMDAEARQHFQLGRTFYDSGRFQQAVEEFEAAYKLSGRPQLLYNVYVAQRDVGELQEAVDALRAYLDQVPDAPDRVNLKARLESLEAQAKRQAEQEALAAKASAQPVAEPKTRTEIQRSKVPFIVAGAGGGMLLGSVITGVLAKGKADDLDESCGGSTCPVSEQSNVDSTRTLAITTDVLWSVGAATAITGVVLWLTGALDTEREVPVSLNVTPNGISTTLSGRF